jgi:SAM-dependent methyltransferase
MRARIGALDVLVVVALVWAAARLYLGGGDIVLGHTTIYGGELLLGVAIASAAAAARYALTRGRPTPLLWAPIARALVGETTPASESDEDPQRRWPLWLGMGSVSLSVLLTELLLTRLFSVTLYYHFAFMAISLALLGLGFSGVLVFLLAPRFPAARLYVQIAWLSVGSAVAVVLAAISILRAEIALEFSPANFATLLRVYLVAFVPLLLSGLIVTLLFTHRARVAGRLYFFDLTGAALAGPLLVPLSAWIGAPRAVVLAAAIMAAAGALLSRMGKYPRGVAVCGGLAVALAVLVVAGRGSALLDVHFAKGQKQSQVLFSAWNSFSRVAVYDRNHETWGLSPNYHGELPPTLWLDIDASASTPITGLSGPLTHVPHFQWILTAYGYKLRPGGEALVIGAGGGRDLLSALNHGLSRVDGVEINDIIVRDVMRGRFRDYSGNIYGQPNVDVHLDDGRSWVRRSDRHFDVIQMSLVDTWAATSAGAYVLSENNLYTVEAFVDYLGHLKPDGVLSIARWPNDSLRTLTLYIEACRALGLGDPSRKVVVMGHTNLIQMLFKRVDYTDDELKMLLTNAVAQRFDVYYMPAFALHQQPDNDYARIIANPAAFIASAELDLSPVTDDRPFFFNFTRIERVPEQVAKARFLFGDGIGNLLSVLIITTGMVVLCFVVPMIVWFARRRRRRLETDGGSEALAAPPSASVGGARGGRMLFYFACLGFGYIVVEVVLIQKLTLLLGHPTTSLVVSLSGMLAGSGLGAGFISRRSAGLAVKDARVALAVVTGAVLLLTFILQPIASSVISATIAPRILVALAFVVSVGFVMGMPLPLGMRVLDRHPDDRTLIPWAWGLNGALSVFGSCAAIFFAMFFGFNNAMRIGAVAYVLALAVMLTLEDAKSVGRELTTRPTDERREPCAGTTT